MRIKKATERWFEIPGDEDGARILVRHLRPGEIQDIVDEVMVQEIVYEQPEEGEKAKSILRQKNDTRKDRKATILASLVGWESFFDEFEQTLEHNEENVLRAVREIDGLAEFIQDCRKTLAEDHGKEFADQKKT